MNPLLSMVMLEEFHLPGGHDQVSHGGGGGVGVVEGATVEHKGGSISGLVSGHGHASRRGRVRVLWEDGSVSEVDPDDLVVTEALAVRANPLLSMEDNERLVQREALAGRVEAFYNKCNSEEDGRFCEGADGPGRKRDPGNEDLGKKGISAPKKAKVAPTAAAAAPKKKLTEGQLAKAWLEYEAEYGHGPPKGVLEDYARRSPEEKAKSKAVIKANKAAAKSEAAKPKPKLDKQAWRGLSPNEQSLAERDDPEGVAKIKAEIEADRQAVPKGGPIKVSRKSLDQDMEDAIAVLTPKEQKAVLDYRVVAGSRVDGTDSFNEALREGKTPSPNVAVLDKVIQRSVLVETIVGHRAVVGDFATKIKRMKVGESYTDKGYTSVAGTVEAAEIFEDFEDDLPIMKFVLPKGSSAAVVGGGESELIVGRGSTWVKTGDSEFTLEVA